MKRRTVLAGAASLAASGLARPAIAQPAASRALRFVPESGLQQGDPIWTTTTIARNHGFLVWDTLYGLDEALQPRPQMCAGHEVSDDGRTWRFRLREGLSFHDGAPVRAVDCVASIRRWMQRDGFGRQIAAQLDELGVLDDAQFQFRLLRPFPRMLRALAKPVASVLFIMPERVAQTSPEIEITDFTGSGPFTFLADEFRPGVRAAYARNVRYQPRQEPASFTAGGKVVRMDRIEWTAFPDPAMTASLLADGEQDWWQAPIADLLPVLRASRGVTVRTIDRAGVVAILRFNCIQPPFDNAALRRAILPAIDQQEYMHAAMGEATEGYHTGVGVFTPGSPLASDAGLTVLTGPRDPALARRLVRESGYAGEPVVLLAPVDHPAIEALCQVTRDLFAALGLNVQYVPVEWAGLVQRRASREPAEQGGWSAFCTTCEALSFDDPGGHYPIFGNGAQAWYGWPTSPRLEALRSAWFAAADLAAEKQVAQDIQLAVWQEAPYVPLGQLVPPTAFRADLSDLGSSPFPVFWGVRKP
ncbi:MAG: ABC transporter substrate-binding protein [Acidisphaera sp.]|nr:ABC transporter substrate-binding protein [Acidisphaera sp.]